jgi:endo-1,4-beta-xylanase
MSKMQKKRILLSPVMSVILALSLVVAAAAQDRGEWDLDLPSLKDTFAEYFAVGNIMEPAEVANDRTTAMFMHHYNFVTAENAMKPGNLLTWGGEWDFRFHQPDFLVNWGVENDIKVVGHTLLWHSQSVAWLNTGADREPLTRAEARVNMERYINEVAGHYAGRIHSWDVVNEAFLTSVSSPPAPPVDEGWWKHMLRTGNGGNESSPWYAAYANGMDEAAGECPSDYIYDAFVFTRLADPNAILYYNDFNETQAGKREAMAQMTEELNARWANDPLNTEPGRLLVEGLGMQAHYWTADLSPASVELTIMRFAETGAEVSITELDIPMGRYGALEEATEENLARQTQLYKEIFEVFIRQAEHIERVTFWGKADNQSWRHEGNRGHPLLFDSNFNPKAAFHAVINTTARPVPLESSTVPEAPATDEGTDTAAPGNLQFDTPQEEREGDPPNYTLIGAIAVVAVILIVTGIILIAKKKKG